MNDLSKRDVQDLKTDIDNIIKSLDLDDKKILLRDLEMQSVDENLWKDNRKAQSVMSKISYLKDEINEAESLKGDIYSLSEIFNSIEQETEQNQLIDDYLALKDRLDNFSLRQFLSGEYDSNSALLTIYAGQGGTEANDWAEMLYRMYTMYFDRKGWKYTTTELSKGNETGIITVTIRIDQPFAFGLLKKEYGTHRLVRISPFNAQGLRQTTFAGVEVLPVIDDDSSIEIDDNDIIFKAVKSGGPGGQNVNKTSSAVQITHIPTGICVQCSSERSQAQNRENAMALLKAKLWKIKDEEKLKKISDIKGDYKVAGWGNQIRNYVLHPYKLVKDLRTGVESSNPEDVLDGDLDKLIEAEVRIQ